MMSTTPVFTLQISEDILEYVFVVFYRHRSPAPDDQNLREKEYLLNFTAVIPRESLEI